MPITHRIQEGDSVIKLSEHYGHFSLTIWNDPANADLKERRNNMNILFPGDVVVIPDMRPKKEAVKTCTHQRFRRKGVPALVRLQLFKDDKPRANQPYRLDVDGHYYEGTTNAEGTLEAFIPTHAAKGILVVGPDNRIIKLNFGHLDPIDEVRGVQKRLKNLGYDPGAIDGDLSAATREALRAFQRRYELDESGEPDVATRDKLREIHDALGT